MLDLLRFAIALLPLAAYANVLGLLRLRAKPTVLSGAMDILLLGLAAVGLVAIGPIELFFPRAAYSLLGSWVWVVLIALYVFVVMLIAMNSTPRLIVYGLDSQALRELMRQTLDEQRIQADWLGDLVELPELGIRAFVEPASRSQVSQIQAAGKQQNLSGWLTLERLLVEKAAGLRATHRSQAAVWLGISFVLFGIASLLIGFDLPRLRETIAMFFEG